MALSGSFILFGILAFTFSLVQCEKLPSYIKPCPKSSNLTACLIENIDAAVPHVIDGQTDFLPSVNPYKVPLATVKLDWLDLKMTDIEYPLLEGLRIKKLNLDLEKGDLGVTVHASKLAGYGAYSVDGIMFGMNLNTTGFMYGNIVNVCLHVDMKGKYETRDGKRYLMLKKSGWKLDLQSGFSFWENLYPGDDDKTLRANDVMNQNFPKLVAEVDQIFEKSFGVAISDGFAKFFAKYSVDDLFVD